MVATFLIEFGLAAYTILRYKMTVFVRLVVAILLCLGIFQLVEFNTCGRDDKAIWATLIGYSAITMLPALGIHLIFVAAKNSSRVAVWAAYGMAALLVASFLVVDGIITGSVCRPNYATFQLDPGVSEIFGVYYFFWLIAGLFYSLRAITRENWKVFVGIAAGYLTFLLPTAVVNFLVQSRMEGTASIMCGFAVFFALILGLWVLPNSGAEKR